MADRNAMIQSLQGAAERARREYGAAKRHAAELFSDGVPTGVPRFYGTLRIEQSFRRASAAQRPFYESLKHLSGFALQCVSSNDASAARRYRLLVADDDERIWQELHGILARDYNLVGTAADGKQLVEMAANLRPDAAVVDISMPVMNGFEAVSRLKSAGVESKIIFFTTNGSPAYVRKAFGLGAAGYVLKALGNEELPHALRAVLNGGTFVSPRIGFNPSDSSGRAR